MLPLGSECDHHYSPEHAAMSGRMHLGQLEVVCFASRSWKCDVVVEVDELEGEGEEVGNEQ